jgi:predicted nucleotidyltransferase
MKWVEAGMVALTDIEEFSQALVREFHPRRVVLFGSHASGTARDDSDVDLLVTMDYQGNSLCTAARSVPCRRSRKRSPAL